MGPHSGTGRGREKFGPNSEQTHRAQHMFSTTAACSLMTFVPLQSCPLQWRYRRILGRVALKSLRTGVGGVVPTPTKQFEVNRLLPCGLFRQRHDSLHS